MAAIDLTADILDTRDIVDRLEELEDEDAELDEDEQEELTALVALREEASSDPEWTYGMVMIKESYFEDYARQTASDLGLISDDAEWPSNFIDWAAAADCLKNDYTEYTLDGTTYYAR